MRVLRTDEVCHSFFATTDMALDGVEWDVHDIGNVLVLEVLEIKQRQRLAILRFELVDNQAQRVTE
jgi:hypothetical protein